MEPKPVLWSKTFWVNMIVIIVAALTGIMNSEVITNYPGIIATLTGAIGVINIVLRLFTKVAIR